MAGLAIALTQFPLQRLPYLLLRKSLLLQPRTPLSQRHVSTMAGGEAASTKRSHRRPTHLHLLLRLNLARAPAGLVVAMTLYRQLQIHLLQPHRRILVRASQRNRQMTQTRSVLGSGMLWAIARQKSVVQRWETQVQEQWTMKICKEGYPVWSSSAVPAEVRLLFYFLFFIFSCSTLNLLIPLFFLMHRMPISGDSISPLRICFHFCLWCSLWLCIGTKGLYFRLGLWLTC
jgi:hypothetical protein